MVMITLKVLAVVVLTLASGYGDSRGFIYSAQIWENDQLNWNAVAASAAGFTFGIIFYWLALKFLLQIKQVSPEVQTLGWFAVTIAGVALASGQLFKWSLVDQTVAVGIVLGTGWLLVRTG
jgi:hypothetical protein